MLRAGRRRMTKSLGGASLVEDLENSSKSGPVERDDAGRPNRHDPCEKGGLHSWVTDDTGDTYCEKCSEPLFE